MGNKYTSDRIIDGRRRKVIVDENGKIVNRNPNKGELKGYGEEPYVKNSKELYTNKKLLGYLRQFYEENGRVPVITDFDNNPWYPNCITYKRRFGSWFNALKLARLDVDTMVKRGVLDNNYQKGRKAEIMIIDHFEKNPVDLSGKNHVSPCDGICPNGKMYDVKSSGLLENKGWLYWRFGIGNRYKEEIEIYYLLAFNKDYTKLEYAWRVPGEIAESNGFYVGASPSSKRKFTVYNMKEYDITEKLRDIIK